MTLSKIPFIENRKALSGKFLGQQKYKSLQVEEKVNNYFSVCQSLRVNPRIWLVTGAAGFIGSSLVEKLLMIDQTVVGLDNFSTGYIENLNQIEAVVSADQWQRFRFIEGDIRCLNDCMHACQGVDYVLHQAALGSVPRSLNDPIATNATNVDGFLNMLLAARSEGVRSFTYAASSSTYGDHPSIPKVEDAIGRPLSPYAVTKLVNELYAEVFERNYDFKATGLRYFNVFGPRQDPNGAYAAVIPKWIGSMLEKQSVIINGDGLTSRDFCFIDNAVQANVLAATSERSVQGEVFNIALGDETTLIELFFLLRGALKEKGFSYPFNPEYGEFRDGDVRHSRADISKATRLLGYCPTVPVGGGIERTISWWLENSFKN